MKNRNLVGIFADEESDALITALYNSALASTEGSQCTKEDRVYLYIENTPKITLISDIVDELHNLGYCIKSDGEKND